MGNANDLALQLTLGACMIWLLPRKAGLLPCLLALGAVAFAVAVTGSRKAVLVALCFLVLVCLQTAQFLPKGRRRLWVSLAVAVPCLLGLFLAPTIYQHAEDLLSVRRTLEYQGDSSYQKRAEMIEQGLALWQHAPLFGNGLDSFRGLSGQDTYAHNNYVELLCGLGIVGTLLFYAIHAGVLIRAARARRSLKRYCWVFVLTLLLADIGAVSYKSKQTIMILMVLTVMTTSRYALKHHHRVAEHRAPSLKRFKPGPRRFVLGA
jgi:O-antigen ligase